MTFWQPSGEAMSFSKFMCKQKESRLCCAVTASKKLKQHFCLVLLLIPFSYEEVMVASVMAAEAVFMSTPQTCCTLDIGYF